MIESHRREVGAFGGVKHAAGSIRDLLQRWNERASDGSEAPLEERRKSA
jgi:hypothetical protein